MRRITTITFALMTTAGCTQWEELPEGATGLVQVREASMTGQIGGMQLDGTVNRRVGYCRNDGFEVEVASSSKRGTIMSSIQLANVFLGEQDARVLFDTPTSEGTLRAAAESDLIDVDGLDPQALVLGCAGEKDGQWDTEVSALHAELRVRQLRPDKWHVSYEAVFPEGDNVSVEFEMDMPAND